MDRKRIGLGVAFILVIALPALCHGVIMADSFGTGANQFTIEFVPISGSTNPTSGSGIVNNDYRIGKFEITNDQWQKFKNAYGMVTGNPLSAYDAEPYWTGMHVPTGAASWYEAAQFVNWLNTSTGHQAAYKFTGTQGTSDYTMATWSTSEADNGTNLYRHKDSMYYLPTDNEWLKAAYWNGTSLQAYSNASSGDLVSGDPDPAKWNYGPSAGSEPWNVGSGAEELNGTLDMMGNIAEWTESPYLDPNFGTGAERSWLGGAYDSDKFALSRYYRLYHYPTPDAEFSAIGFRIASDVPEPCSLGLLWLGGWMLFKRRPMSRFLR